ncbi:MAG: hypothetical protein M0Z89_05470 [Nitrospiraceae bacterium]|nr:hypothetical protein [Nitrospiraceae bacterium]
MGFSDIVWMGLIIAGTLYLLYRSVWKKKGHCAGCDSQSCVLKKYKM